jgi:hypothetical protein
MPIHNERKNLIMFLAGECFGDKEVTNSLASKGHEFNPDDRSFLIHLYEEQEQNFFSGLNGWLSGIIVDARRETPRIMPFVHLLCGFLVQPRLIKSQCLLR